MNPLIECLGWTLVHFLWQGLAIALVLAIALRLLRNGPPNHRYLAGCVALFLMATAPAITSYFIAPRLQPSSPPTTERVPFALDSDNATPTPASAAPKVIITAKSAVPVLSIAQRLEMLLPWLVVGWAMGVLALSCRLLAGWFQINRLRCNAIETLAEPWHKKLAELAQHLGINRPLRLFKSALIEVPTVIGWLRPVILLPASCLVGLSPTQLESILAHELAHIRRHDYLVNLLQSMVETLLFYHPAVWWVSRQIREERENCCDDIAVKICGDPIEYARALATLEEMRPASAQLAVAASGGSLLQRIQRLLGKSSSSTSSPTWPLAGVIIAIMILAMATGLRGNRAMAADSLTPETFLTSLGVYHYTNASSILELTIQSNQLLLAASDDSRHTSAGVNTWSPGRHWFLYVAKGMQVWAYDGNRGLWLLRADSLTGSGSSSIEWLRERPPAVVEKRLPKDVIKLLPTALETREFHLNSGKFTKALEKAGYSFPDVEIHGDPKSTGGKQVTDRDNYRRSLALQVMIRQFFFDSHGIDIPLDTIIAERNRLADPKTPLAGKTLYYDERAGRLLVRSTSQELDNVSTIIADINNGKLADTGVEKKSQSLNDRPPQDSHSVARTETRTNGNLTITFTETGFGPTAGVDSGKTNGQSDVISNEEKGAQTQSFRTNEIRIATIVQDGKLLFEAGKLDEAEAKLNMAYQEDPSNVAVYEYLQLIRQKRLAGATFRTEPGTNQTHASKGRQAIESKLHQIRLDSVEYDNLPLVEVIKNLNEQAKLHDPDRVGITFFIDRETATPATNSSSAIDPATGLPRQVVDLSTVRIRINPALTNIRLADVLDAITKTADKPIYYSTLDYAVVFSPGPRQIPLETRTFHVDAEKFLKALENAGFSPRNFGTNDRTIANLQTQADASPHRDLQSQLMIRQFLKAIGIDFKTNNPSQASKAVYLNESKGILYVRATAQELDDIASALTAVNTAGLADADAGKKVASVEVPAYSISSTAPANDKSELLTLAYRLDINGPPGGVKKTSGGAGAADQAGAQHSLEEYLANPSPGLYPINPANPNVPSGYILNFGTGTLIVRARKPDLDKISEILYKRAPQHSQGAAQTKTPTNGNLVITFTSTNTGTTFTLTGSPTGKTNWTLDGLFFPTNSVADGVKSSAGTNNPAAGKAIFLKDPDGIRFVRAKSQDLDIITTALEPSNKREPAPVYTKSNLPLRSQIPELRVYSIDLEKLFESVKHTNGIAKPFTQSTAEQALQDYLAAADIDIRSTKTTDTNYPNRYLLDFMTKKLIVTAGKADMDKISAVLAKIAPKAQINIKVKFVEIDEAKSKTKGFDWLLSSSPGNLTTNSPGALPEPMEARPITMNSNVSPFLKITNSIVRQFTGILTGPQFRAAMAALEQRDDVDILTAPEVTTESGRQAQVQAVDLVTIVTGANEKLNRTGASSNSFQTETVPLGPSLEVIPRVCEDGYLIDMNIFASVIEFLGYAKIKPPTPQLRERHLMCDVTVFDGQTVVLGGLSWDTINNVQDKVPLLGSLPLVGRLFKSQSSSKSRKNLLVFITPTLINPDGTTYHSSKELAELRFSVPPPQAPASPDAAAKKTN